MINPYKLKKVSLLWTEIKLKKRTRKKCPREPFALAATNTIPLENSMTEQITIGK